MTTNRYDKTTNQHNVDPNTAESDKSGKELGVDEEKDTGCLLPGKCEATIINAYTELRLPKNYDMVHLDFVLQTESHVGTKISKEYHLTTERARDFMRREFKTLDLALTHRDEFPDICGKIIGKKVKLNIAYSRSGNQAVYITGDATIQSKVLDPEGLWENLPEI